MEVNRSIITAAFLCALLVAGQAPAQNQSRLVNTPAEKFAMASGGVDMRTGRYVYSETDLSIGAGNGGLALTRTMTESIAGHASPFGNLTHNWDIMISDVPIDSGDAAANGTAYQLAVHFGGRAHTYRSRQQDTGFIQV